MMENKRKNKRLEMIDDLVIMWLLYRSGVLEKLLETIEKSEEKKVKP